MAKTKTSKRKAGLKSTNAALLEAIERGDIDAVAIALSRGISKKGRPPQESPLARALGAGLGAAAQLLIAAGADLDEIDDLGRSPLHRAPDVQTARLLIARGVDVQAKDAAGETPLHLASAAGDAERVRLLIAAGADVESETPAGRRPFLLASTEETRQALIDGGALDLFHARGDLIRPTKRKISPKTIAELTPGCLTVDEAGHCWFAGEAIYRHDGSRLDRFSFAPSLTVTACVAAKASVFFATSRGLLETTCAGDEWRLHDTTNSGLFDADLVALATDHDGTLYVLGRAADAAQKPVSTYDGERWGVLQPGSELPSEGQTRGLGFDAAGGLLLLLDDGFAYRGDDGGWAIERSIGTGGTLSPTVYQAVGRGGSTFFVTSLGLFRYRRGRFDRYQTPHPPQVICFAGDHLYIGMVGGGLAQLTLGTKELRVFDSSNSALPSDDVTAVVLDSDETLWVQSGSKLLRLRDSDLLPL